MRARTAARIREAIARLASARGMKTNGLMTTENLAREAGVSRSQLYSYPELLKEWCWAKGTGSRTIGRTLQDKLADTKAENRKLKAENAAKIRRLEDMQSHLLDRIFVQTRRWKKAEERADELARENERLARENAELTRQLASLKANVRVLKQDRTS